MSKFLFNLIFLILIKDIINNPNCEEGKNNCTKCDYINQLCIKCNKDIFIPDENGGCKGAKKCLVGMNYCQECQEDSELCKVCEDGYFPDENGGCSYANNCEISYRGECIKCKDNYILIGENNYLNEGFILCKSIYSPDFKNCELIFNRKGICSKCKNGFYLNCLYNRCIEIPNCLESSFGECFQCINGYYLDKKENLCKKEEKNFVNCKQTIDGEICEICDEGYYFDEDGNCIAINYCSKVNNLGICEKCISGYYLSSSNNMKACTKDKNCYEADKDSGLCLQCNENYYIDYKDGKCKSNLENNDFKYCKSAREFCNSCIYNYYLGDDLKCSNEKGCLESNNGICNACSEGYYLGLDHKCSLIKYCIYSLNENNCEECLEGYYYNQKTKTCLIADNDFQNCKIMYANDIHCSLCRDNYYLNMSDSLCYSNENLGDFYKCAYTDTSGNTCASCIQDYYYGYKYHICSKIEGCQILKDENTCSECEEYYCLNVKNGTCFNNYNIIDEENKYYYGCIQTNEEGNACEICEANLTLENGLCVDKIHCEKEIDGVCQKCAAFEEDYYYYCLNSYFGCVEIGLDFCLECNNITDLNSCTKCEDGYQLNDVGFCVDLSR